MSTEGFLIDASVRRQVFMVRFANNQVRLIDEVLKKLEQSLIGIIGSQNLENEAQLQLALNDYRKSIDRHMEELRELIEDATLQAANVEVEFSNNLLNEASIAIPQQIDESLLRTNLFSYALAASDPDNAVTLKEALDQFSNKKSSELIRILDEGLILGLTTPEISRNISEFSQNRVRHQADTLTRTAISHASSMARKTLYNENQGIIDGYQWVSTLDSRTTLLCAGRDGRIYPLGSNIYPPAHWNACAKDTLVLTDRGRIKIQDVKVGDYAMTHTGEYKKVTAVMAKHHKGKICNLVGRLGVIARLTNDHPILTTKGYKAAGDLNTTDNIFYFRKQSTWLKSWILGAPVKDTILIDSHNIKTKFVESLVAYSVRSKSAGVSASIKLKKDIVINDKVGNIFASIKLMLKGNTDLVKKIYKQLFMKCRR